MNPNNLLCYEMNGEPLDAGHGAPLRLLLPGWFGVANVKWLDRIEVIDTRFAGHFMARDYVTIREEQRDGQTVSRGDLGRQGAAQVGAGPGDPHGRRLPDHRARPGAPRSPASRSRSTAARGCQPPSTRAPGRVRLEVLVAVTGRVATPGEHTITSRATDTAGNVQPAMTDPVDRQQADLLGEQRPDHPARPDRLNLGPAPARPPLPLGEGASLRREARTPCPHPASPEDRPLRPAHRSGAATRA